MYHVIFMRVDLLFDFHEHILGVITHVQKNKTKNTQQQPQQQQKPPADIMHIFSSFLRMIFYHV